MTYTANYRPPPRGDDAQPVTPLEALALVGMNLAEAREAVARLREARTSKGLSMLRVSALSGPIAALTAALDAADAWVDLGMEP